MATARDIIKGSLRILGVLASGESPKASELSDSLETLNEMIESFSNESLIIHSDTIETFTCTSGQQVHSMGSGGDFDTTRPLKIKKVLYQDPSNSNLELPIKIREMEEYAGIVNKETQSSISTDVYINPEYPLTKLYFWPVPSEAMKVKIFSEKVIQSFASASTDVDLPPG